MAQYCLIRLLSMNFGLLCSLWETPQCPLLQLNLCPRPCYRTDLYNHALGHLVYFRAFNYTPYTSRPTFMCISSHFCSQRALPMPFWLPKPRFLPTYLLYVCFFFKPKTQTSPSVLLLPQHRASPHQSICKTRWFTLHIVLNLPISFHHVLIKPSSSLICLLDLLLPFLHFAARTTSLRHKPDHGISCFEGLHGSLSSTVKFRTSYHDLQACRSGSCLPCQYLLILPPDDQAPGTLISFLFLDMPFLPWDFHTHSAASA